MADSPVTATTLAQTLVDRAKGSFHQSYKTINDVTNRGSEATEHAISVLTAHLKGGGVTATIIGTVLSAFADIVSLAVDEITQVKKAGGPGLHDLIAALLSDSLLIEVAPEDIPNGAGPQGQYRINAALGGKFLNQLKVFMGANGPVTGDSAEAGASALLGLGMQMSVNTGLLAILGGCVPGCHLDELKEIGEMLEKSLGLGRLNRQALRPYVRNLISQPLDRKMRAKYRQDIIGPAEVVQAMNSGRMSQAEAHQLLAEHGYPDEQIAEIIAQKTPRLSAEELFILGTFHEVPGDSALNTLIADGIPIGTATARLRTLQLKRAFAVQDRFIHEVDKRVEDGHIDAATGSTLLQGAGLDESELRQYQQKWAFATNTPRKRLSQADMLFLYEASQVTISEIGEWATAEGYSPQDVVNIQILFELKATAAARGKGGSTAAAAVHVHAEHVAFVRDLFQAEYQRDPSPAESQGWVALLDTKSRTKGDVKTEIKADPNPPPA
jgi:hypothetical protein